MELKMLKFHLKYAVVWASLNDSLDIIGLIAKNYIWLSLRMKTGHSCKKVWFLLKLLWIFQPIDGNKNSKLDWFIEIITSCDPIKQLNDTETSTV